MMLIAQMVLHSVSGDPTFLYAPHFTPMLVAVAALSWFTRVRRAALGLAVVVRIAGGISNVHRFRYAAGLANQILNDGGNPIRMLAIPPSEVLVPPPPRR